MTPRRFNPSSAQAKLRAIHELTTQLQACGDVTAERLRDDFRVRYTVERILTLLVDRAVKVNTHVVVTLAGDLPPSSYRASFTAAADTGLIEPALASRLAQAAGQRNILIHEYETVDYSAVAQAATTAVADYRAYVTQAARYLAAHADRDEPTP